MSFHARTFADFQHTSTLLACSHELWENMQVHKHSRAGHVVQQLHNSWTFAGHPSPVNIGLLDTLSSSWTFAGQANPANIVLLDTCWTRCPAAGHLLDSQVLQIMAAGHSPRLGF